MVVVRVVMDQGCAGEAAALAAALNGYGNEQGPLHDGRYERYDGDAVKSAGIETAAGLDFGAGGVGGM